VLERGTRRPAVGAALTLDLTAAGETDQQGRLHLAAPCGRHHLTIQQPGFEVLALDLDPCTDAPAAPVRLQPSGRASYETVVRTTPPIHERVRLEADELTRTPGSMGDPLRAIESMPGVSTVTWPAAIYAVRGANPGNTGFFLDDVRIPALFHLALGPSVIHPYFFQGMDFYPGGYPAQYGRYVGGLVSAQTRAPATDGVHVAADVRLVDAGAMASTPFPDGKGAVAIAARYSYTGAMVSLLSDQLRLGYWDYQLRADRPVGPVKLRLLIFGASDYLAPKQIDSWAKDIQLAFHRAALRAELPAGDGALLAAVSLGLDHSRAPLAWTFPIQIDARNVAPRVAYRRLGRRVDLEVGIDSELTRYTPTNPVQRPGLMDLATRRDAILAAAYLSTTVRAGPALSLTPELRLDAYAIGGRRAVSLGPRLAGRLAVGPGTWIHVAGGHFTQTPSLPLQVPGAESFGLALYGLQRSWQGSAGVGTARGSAFEADVTAYVQRYRLTDERDPVAEHVDPLSDDFMVAREALSYGAELMVRRPATQRLHGWISYSLSRSLRAVGGGVIAPSDWDQRHVLNLVAGYRWGRTTLGGRVHFNTGRPYVVGNFNGAELLRLPPFYQLDLRVDRRIVFDSFLLEVYAELANATLTRQVSGIGPGDGTTRTHDSFRLVIPSLGVHGEF
jgi:hypothetical protein